MTFRGALADFSPPFSPVGQELAHIAFNKSKRNRNAAFLPSPRSSSASLEDADPDAGAESDIIRLPPLDSSIVNPYLMWKFAFPALPALFAKCHFSPLYLISKLEQENLIMDSETEGEREEGDGSSLDEVLSPVKNFERELIRLLRCALSDHHLNSTLSSCLVYQDRFCTGPQ